ncbi:MAG TPA: NADP-dependent oxidoreductase [Acidimicrobiales bacterium]|nr:NADP-dependent oxidoreductase [Acidimicrobiales bacterium]
MALKVVANAYGGPEVLSLVDEPVGPPAEGAVLVDVRAAGTNPFDLKLYSGAFGRDPGALPMALGSEAAGVVIAVGGDAEGPSGPIRVGDEVIAYRAPGAYAQQVLVPGPAVVAKPAALTFEQASGLMLVGTTAVHALTAAAVRSGDTVLVHGASGGVGSMVVQIAVASGARVIGTAAPDRHDALRLLGAEPVAYGDGLVERVRALAPAGVDAAIDTVGTDEAVDVSVELVADRDRIATIAAFGRGGELGIKVLGAGPGADPGTAIRDAARLELVRLVAKGALTVRVARTYPLSEAADAHRELAGGHANGKIILVP